MGYIYKITNDKNNKMYIGKTEHINPEERWKEHLQDYQKKRYEKRPLYEAMNKYGVEHFHFEVIEETKNEEESCSREQYWINKLRTYIGFKDCNGYNATLGGDGKSYLNLNKKEVIDYHTNESMYIVSETAKHFNVSRITVKNILIKNNIPWLSYKDTRNLTVYVEFGGVLQISIKNKIVLNIFENVKEANIYMGKDEKHGNIYNACNGVNNGSHYAYGYLWYYVRDLQKIKDELKFIY